MRVRKKKKNNPLDSSRSMKRGSFWPIPCAHPEFTPTILFTPPPPPPPLLSPSLLPIRVDARKVKTSRNNGRLTSFFNGSCIDSRCTWFRVITRRLAYCAIVGVDLLEPAYGGVVSIRWCVPRFTLRRRSPFPYPPSILRSYPFPKMLSALLRPCYRLSLSVYSLRAINEYE